MERVYEGKRILYVDILNILACFCVILLHCNGIAHKYSNTRFWKESMFVEAIAYWAVPVFFMLSGVNLMEYREKYSTKEFFYKRFQKTVIPYVFWSIISFIYKTIIGEVDFEFTVSSIILILTNSKAENVYWFFIPLFMVYLSIPVISLIKDNKKILQYAFCIAFIVYSVYPPICNLLGIPQNGDAVFPAAGGYMLFVIMGYLFSKIEFSRNKTMIIYLMGIIGVGLRYGTTVIWSMKNGILDQTFWGYLGFPSVFLAAAVFVGVKQTKWEVIFKSERIRKAISKLSSASFGVYLTHMIVFRILRIISKLPPTAYVWRFAIPFVIYFICVFGVLFMKKIPVLKRLVP